MDTSWKDEGACKSYPQVSWYPEGDSPHTYAMRALALRICNEECSIRPQCLEYALKYEPYGIWGGMSERERRKEKARLRIVATAPWAGAFDVRRDIRTSPRPELPSYLNATSAHHHVILGEVV